MPDPQPPKKRDGTELRRKADEGTELRRKQAAPAAAAKPERDTEVRRKAAAPAPSAQSRRGLTPGPAGPRRAPVPPPRRKRSRAMLVGMALAVVAIASVVAVGLVVARLNQTHGPVVAPPPPPPPPPLTPFQRQQQAVQEVEASRPADLADYDRWISRCDELVNQIGAATDLAEREKRHLTDWLREQQRRLEDEKGELEDLLARDFRLFQDEIELLLQNDDFDGALARIDERLEGEGDRNRRMTLEDRKHSIEEMRGPLQDLGEIARRIASGGPGPGDADRIAELLTHDDPVVQGRAETTLVRLHLPELLRRQEGILAQARDESRRRFDASERRTGEPDQAILFVGPNRPTPLDDLVDGLPEELQAIKDKYATAVRRLQAARAWHELRGAGAGIYQGDLGALTRLLAGVAPVHYWHGAAALAGEDFPTAIESATAAIQAADGYAEAYALRARAYLETNHFGEAMRDLEAAIERAPDLSYAYLFRGLIKYYRGDLDGTRGDLETAVRLDETMAAAVGLMGGALQGPEWDQGPFEAQSDHYRVISDDSQDRAQSILDRLEAVRTTYAGALGTTLEHQEHPVLVYHFRNQAGFFRYQVRTEGQPNPAVLGFYHPTYRQFIFYNLDDEEGFWHVVYHEGFHHYAHMTVPNIPRWLNEAMAEYVAGISVTPETGVDGFLREYRIRNGLRPMVRGHGYATFREIMQKSGSGEADWYVQGWAMVHFFERAEDGALRGNLETYLRVLREGHGMAEAFRQAFPGRVDMTSAWVRYVRDVLLPLCPEEEPAPSPTPEAAPGGSGGP